MTNEIVLARTRSQLASPESSTLVVTEGELLDDVREFAEGSTASETRRAYASDLKHFRRWCDRQGVESMPALPVTIAQYCAALAKGKADDLGPRKVATIRRRLSSIATEHGLHEADDPTKDARVRTVMRGIRRALGTRVTKKAPLLRDQVRAAADLLPSDRKRERNRALLLFGFESAMRRDELARLGIDHVQIMPAAAVVDLSSLSTKTNQEGSDERIVIQRDGSAWCPVAALEAWIARRGTAPGPLFGIGDKTILRLVKTVAARAGFDPDLFGAHSLRAGYVTTEIMAGTADRTVRKRTRHKSASVMEGYVREADILTQAGARSVD